MNYVAACLALWLSHAIPSAPGVRPALVAWLGPKLFRILYSILSLVTVGWFITAYGATPLDGWLYSPAPWIIPAVFILVPLGLFLMTARLMTPWGEPDKPVGVRGIYRITRFPGSWGVLLWALAHLAATGDIKRVIAFGTFAIIALTALAKNEYVLQRQSSREARQFLDGTSLVPFVATIKGEQGIPFRDIGWKPPLVCALLVAGVLVLHDFAFGVDPLALLP